MSINADSDVMEVMEMVLGDYLAVFVDGLEDQQDLGDITAEEQMSRFIKFSKGCRKICEAFGIDADVLDVDNLLAMTLLCDHYKKEVKDDGDEDSC